MMYLTSKDKIDISRNVILLINTYKKSIIIRCFQKSSDYENVSRSIIKSSLISYRHHFQKNEEKN